MSPVLTLDSQPTNTPDISELYKEHRAFIRRNILKIANPGQDRDDIEGEVWLKIVERIQDFRGEGSLKTWIYMIVRNACYTEYRRIHGQRDSIRFFTPIDSPEALNYFSSLKHSPTTLFEKIEHDACAWGLFDMLDDKERQVLLLTEIIELTEDEAAEILGKTPNAIKAARFRTIDSLRGVIDSHKEHFNGITRVNQGPLNKFRTKQSSKRK